MFDDFNKDNLASWRERVVSELKGKAAENLVWENEDGIKVEPYYTSENSPRLFPVITATENTECDIFEPVLVDNVKEANIRALEALKNGATGLCFNIPGEMDSQNLGLLLDDIALPFIQTGFIVKPEHYMSFCLFLAEHIRHRAYDTKTVNGFIQADFSQVSKKDLPETLQELARDVPACAAALKGMRLFVMDAALYRESGCTAATELGILLSWFKEWLEALEGIGIRYDQVSALMQVNLGNSGDYFLELAKYRICNFLLSRIASKYGNFRPAYILGSTALYNKSRLDPDNNLLRSTTESMSAIAGMCNGLRVHQYRKNGNNAVSRVSRNIPLILQHEAHFNMPRDPASGAWYPEALSFALAEKAWTCFLEIEKEGGMSLSLNNGHLHNLIEKSREEKLQAVKTRKTFQLGVNQFPPVQANIPQTPERPGDSSKPFVQSEPFEELHQQSARLGQKKGRPLNALLLIFGDTGMRNARAGFMKNFMGCAGIAVSEVNWNFDTLPKADFLVLCSSDEEYIKALPHLNDHKGILMLAGNPGAMEETYRNAGIQYFVHARSPIYDTLFTLLQQSGANK